ncbi:MAG: metallophosphoesterase [Nanoarchaeota archaeon]|nr:metallophosphoesterase [Nanoarchaeota archaeon]
MEIQFVKNEGVLVYKDYLVIADLHLGYGKVLKEKGYTIPRQSKSFVERIKRLRDKTNTNKLILLGDVKHNIPHITLEETFEVKRFLRAISELFDEIVIIKGNHDGNIEKLIPTKNIVVVGELKIDDVLFIHGHKYPSEAILKSKLIVMAHTHPTLKLKDKSGVTHKYPCWIVGELEIDKLKRYKSDKMINVIIMPSFNPLVSGYSSEPSGPLSKAIKKTGVILIDLTRV